MKIWNVVFKRFSEIEKGFVWVSDTIRSDQHQTSECGVLEFYNVIKDPFNGKVTGHDVIQSIPPGCWMGVEEQKEQK